MVVTCATSVGMDGMQWLIVLFEIEAPVLFCLRKLRVVAFVLGMGFHLLIALLMKDLIFVSVQMWSFYALFITADEWRWLGQKALSVWAVGTARNSQASF